MAKTGYRFNPETLSYDRIHVSVKKKLWSLVVKFFSSLSLALVIFLIVSAIVDSPKEKALKREKEEILAQYHILNNELERMDEVLKNLETRDDNIYRVIFESEPKALYIQSKSYDEIETLAKNKIEMLASIPAILPVSLKDPSTRFSSSYGYRMHPIYKTVKLHAGMDFSGAVGTPIYATGNGKVVYAEIHQGYGKCVLIDHGFNYQTLYAHMSAYNVKAGQKVKRGDIIGYMGNTGMSTGPHIHYEVKKNGIPVDPINYYFNDLTADEYDKLVTEANNNGQTMD